MIRDNIRDHVWKLKVIPFRPIICESKVENNGIQDIRYYECGYDVPKTGYPIGRFKHKPIGKGEHENLHQVIHCLKNAGISFDNMQIEEWFGGYRVDILGKFENGRVIAVELGSIDMIGKFGLTDEEGIAEFWFGDKAKFIYSLYRIAPITEQALRKESKRLRFHFCNYFKTYCSKERLHYHCRSYYSAYDCLDIIRG